MKNAYAKNTYVHTKRGTKMLLKKNFKKKQKQTKTEQQHEYSANLIFLKRKELIV